MKKNLNEPIALVEELYQQILKFGMVIGKYSIEEVVRASIKIIEEKDEIITNYQQAHSDDQVLIQTMDNLINEYKNARAIYVEKGSDKEYHVVGVEDEGVRIYDILKPSESFLITHKTFVTTFKVKRVK